METQKPSFAGSARALHRRAVKIPLPNEEAELSFHRNMANVADAQERKAEMIANPGTSLLDAYEHQLDGIAESYELSLQENVGEDYEAVARSYLLGERSDGIAAMAAYLLEGVWRLQQLFTITDAMFFPVVLRYPRCCTVNIRFASGHATKNAVLYESPEHSHEDLEGEHWETYQYESRWSQKQAAREIRSTARIIRDEFPDPRGRDFEDRKTGGIVSAFGRRGSVFSSAIERVAPDPNRFGEHSAMPELIDESPIAKRTEREWLTDGHVVL